MGKILIQQLVEIPSVSGNEGEVAQFIRQYMDDRGFQTRIDEVGNVIGVIGKGKKTVLLSGHMDTVPGDIPVRIEDGKLFGRGSVDAKGCMATFIEAASFFKDSKDITVVVLGTVEEELEGKGAHYFSEHTAIKPDYIIIGEPSYWEKITLGYKGSIYLEYFLRKAIAHTAHPVPSAVEDALGFSNKLRRYAKEFNEGMEKAFGMLNFSIRSINTTSDGLHEEVQLLINFRTPLDFSYSELAKLIHEYKGEASITLKGKEDAIKSGKNNALVRSFVSVIRERGGTPRFVVKTGTADMNTIGHHFKDTPIVAYGPGDSSLDHTPIEHLELAEYEKAIEVVKNVIEKLGAS